MCSHVLLFPLCARLCSLMLLFAPISSHVLPCAPMYSFVLLYTFLYFNALFVHMYSFCTPICCQEQILLSFCFGFWSYTPLCFFVFRCALLCSICAYMYSFVLLYALFCLNAIFCSYVLHYAPLAEFIVRTFAEDSHSCHIRSGTFAHFVLHTVSECT